MYTQQVEFTHTDNIIGQFRFNIHFVQYLQKEKW